VVTVTAIIFFTLPFLFFYLSGLAHPDNAEAAGFAVLIPAAVAWLISGTLGLAGIIIGACALVKGGRSFLIPIAMVISSVPFIVVVFFLARWLIRGY
jgi:hypothetical protein